LDHAIAIEQPAPDVYVVRLGEHAFHEASPAFGRSVRSDDLVFSMRRYRDHPLVLDDWWHSTLLAGEGGSNERTVVIRTHRPYAYSLAEMGRINAGAILPQEVIEQQADLRAGTAGSGPMQLGSSDAAIAVRIERFDAHEPDAAFVDAMEFRTFGSKRELATAFGRGEIDVLSAGNRNEIGSFVTSGDAVVARRSSLAWTSIGLRVDRPPFADPRVRQALDIAIDRASLSEVALLGDGVAVGPASPGFWSLEQAEIDAAQMASLSIDERRAEARRLLAAAAVEHLEFALQVAGAPELVDLAGLLKQQLSAIGVNVRIEPATLVSWYFNYRQGAFEATLISHPPFETPDGSLRLYHSNGAVGGGNQFGFSDPAIDALIERSWGEMERDARRSPVLSAQRLMIAARPLLHLVSGPFYTVARSSVQDSGLELPGSLASHHYRQWLDVPDEGAAE
jgi:ABC-type transport system substrate-binding protein